jgi:hypothetical protein
VLLYQKYGFTEHDLTLKNFGFTNICENKIWTQDYYDMIVSYAGFLSNCYSHEELDGNWYAFLKEPYKWHKEISRYATCNSLEIMDIDVGFYAATEIVEISLLVEEYCQRNSKLTDEEFTYKCNKIMKQHGEKNG